MSIHRTPKQSKEILNKYLLLTNTYLNQKDY